MGTTVLVDSILDEGQTFHDKRTPDKTSLSETGHKQAFQNRTVMVLHVLEVLHFWGWSSGRASAVVSVKRGFGDH